VRWRWAAVLAALLVAGCGAPSTKGTVRLGDGSHLSLDLPSSAAPTPDDIRGAVSGVVVDDGIFPVANATVTVRGRGWTDTSDAQGRFSFLEEPPGLYTLVAHADGHADGIATVNIHSGEVTKAILLVPRLPSRAPYHVTWAFDKARTVEGWLATGVPADLAAFDAPPATVVVESVWDPLTWVDERALQYNVTGAGHPEVGGQAGDGANPLRVAIDGKDLAPNEYAVRVLAYPNAFAVPIEVRGRTFVTLFYGAPAPDGWSFVGGDA